ncbi:MAG: hypothetical protein WA510_13385, partial [Acidobacteriaceae bacterium]
MSSLALHLERRGHRVTFFCLADSEAFLTRAGLACSVFGREALPPGYSKAVSDELGKLHGLRGLRYTLARFAGEMDAQLAELPAAISAAGIDALVIDQFFTSGSTIAGHLHLPYVHAANALLGNVDEKLPPISFGWANDSNLFALMRNKAAYLFLRTISRPIRTKLNAQRRIWGLLPYTEFLNERFGTRPQICQQPPGFEFPQRTLPKNFYFVGPLHNRENRAKTPFP